MQSYNYQSSDKDTLELQKWHTSSVPNPAQSSSRHQVPLQLPYASTTSLQEQHLNGLASGSGPYFDESSGFSGATNAQGGPLLPGTSHVAVNNAGLGGHSQFLTNVGLVDQYPDSTLQASYIGLGGRSQHQLNELAYIPSPYLESSSSWPQDSSAPLTPFSVEAFASGQHQPSPSSQTYVSGYGGSPTPSSTSYNTGIWLQGQCEGHEPQVAGMYLRQACGVSAETTDESGLWQSLHGAGGPGGTFYGDSQYVEIPNSWAHHRSSFPQIAGGSYHLPELEFSPPPEASSFAHQVDASSQHLFQETLSPYSPGLLDASSPMSSSSWSPGPETPQGSPAAPTPQAQFDDDRPPLFDPKRPCQCADGGPANRFERHWEQSCHFNPHRWVLKCPVPTCKHFAAGKRYGNLQKHIKTQHLGMEVSLDGLEPRKRSEVVAELGL